MRDIKHITPNIRNLMLDLDFLEAVFNNSDTTLDAESLKRVLSKTTHHSYSTAEIEDASYLILHLDSLHTPFTEEDVYDVKSRIERQIFS